MDRVPSRARQDLHEVYANTRVSLADTRQSVEYMPTQVHAVPEVGDQLTGVIGGLRQVRVNAVPEACVPLTRAIGGSALASTDVVEVFSPSVSGRHAPSTASSKAWRWTSSPATTSTSPRTSEMLGKDREGAADSQNRLPTLHAVLASPGVEQADVPRQHGVDGDVPGADAAGQAVREVLRQHL